MKFQELKEKFKSKYTMRMLAGVLCVALAGGSIGVYRMQAGYTAATKNAAAVMTQKAAEDDETLTNKIFSMFPKKDTEEQSLDGKEETVYLITDANGNVTETIVSGWLKNGSESAQIQDVSNLSDIENVKGDETFTQNGDQITWQADGNDIYYKGRTTQETPITEKVTYYLDGAEIAPEELAGKSGRVTIRFDYTNHAKTAVMVNGKQEEIYIPFTVVSGIILGDNFRNVTVNNGRIISDGNRNAAVGFAMPGLKESLAVDESDFDEDFEFPEYVEVTADVEDFSLEMTATVALTGLLSDSDISNTFDLSEMDNTVDDLTDAMGRLKDGGGDLAEGLDTLNDSLGEFSNGVGTLKDGVDAYTDGAVKLKDGILTLNESSGSLETGVNTLNSSAKTISDGIQKLDKALNTAMTDKEKAAAKKEVDAAVDAQFAEGSAAYNMIYGAAQKNFNDTMTNEAAVSTVQNGIQAGMQAQGLTSEGVVAALAAYYAEHGFTDASSGQVYSPQACQSNVPGTDTTYAAYFANAVLNGGLSSALAGGITDGIASQGASAVGKSVVDACKSAAKMAGESAAVTGAESAKKQAASAIEAKDAKSGHSLVSGAKALSAGTQQLADNVPALKNGINQLLDGANTLVSNNAALKDGVSKLSDGTTKISDGVVKLDDGAHELSDGLEEFDKKAISKLVDAYQGDVKDLVERIKAVLQAGEDYGTFCGAADGVDASTKFIFRTDAVKAE